MKVSEEKRTVQQQGRLELQSEPVHRCTTGSLSGDKVTVFVYQTVPSHCKNTVGLGLVLGIENSFFIITPASTWKFATKIALPAIPMSEIILEWIGD